MLKSAGNSPLHHSFSYTFLHPVLGYGPRPASAIYPYPVAQDPGGGGGCWRGGVHDFVSRKTGRVYREMRKTLLRELSHRNSFLPLLLLTAMCMHTFTRGLKILRTPNIPYLDFKE